MSKFKLPEISPFYRFILIAGLCYIGWFLGYDLWLKQQGSLDDFLGYTTSMVVVKFMQLLGYNATYELSYTLYFFYNNGEKLLQMVPACNGQVLYPLFIGFIIATPGKFKHKLLMITTGSILIFIINCLRVLALCLIKIHAPQYLAFNHKYTFTTIVYGCIFGMWLFWIHYFVKAQQENTNLASK